MTKTIKIRLVDIAYWAAIIGTDIFIYMILGILLMRYDDNWDSSQGEYGSLASMDLTDTIIYIMYNCWHLINAIAIIYIGYKIYKRIKQPRSI